MAVYKENKNKKKSEQERQKNKKNKGKYTQNNILKLLICLFWCCDIDHIKYSEVHTKNHGIKNRGEWIHAY